MKVFISHSKINRRRAERLANSIHELGIEVWFDEWEILVGHNLADQIYNGIRSSDFILILLTKESIKSRWVKEEMDIAKTHEIESGGTFVVPLLYEDCEIPLALKSKVYADFRKSFEHGFGQLSKILTLSQKGDLVRDTGQSDDEIPIIIISHQILLNIMPKTIEYLNNPTKLEGSIEEGLNIISSLAERLSVDRKFYSWIDDYTSMIHNQKLVKRWFEKKDSSIFGTWYRETVLYKGGLAQKLSLNSRLAMDMGEILFSTRKEWIHDFEAVFEELDFSLGFRQLFKKSGRSNIPRLLDALWLELGELKNYKKLREIYLKRQQASGVTAGFSLSHNSFLMYEPEIESAPIAYLITKSAEYIIKELHAYDECVLVMDLVNQVLSEKLSTHSDHFVKRLVILNQKILALARRTSLISAAGKAFLLGMLIGSIPFTSDGEFGTERIREIECLANTLHLQGNAKKLLKSTLSAIFYDGADKIDLNKMIITISESFRSGESGVRLEMRDDTN